MLSIILIVILILLLIGARCPRGPTAVDGVTDRADCWERSW
jgi:hypothetical protein